MSETSLSANVGAFIREFARTYPPAEAPTDSRTIYLPFRNGDPLLWQSEDKTYRLLQGEPGQTPEDIAATIPGLTITGPALFLGFLDGVPCVAFDTGEGPADDDGLAPSLRPAGLRALYGQVSEAEYGLAGYAAQIVRFERVSRFCPVDGTPTESEPNGWARRCPKCGHSAYPPVSPAVLILVHDGADRILLARKPGWGKRYSILAGFVEPGETLEECCWREALEESGVETDEFQYRGSQPWPFPHQLMVGFFCRHASGEIKIDENELEHADWFRYDALPELPPPLSLSRQLINLWVASRQK